MLSRSSRPERKNGRFTYEPSVLYATLAEATMAKKNTSPENDFLLLLFFLERKERERFLFLKKRNKRHCGTGDLSEKNVFPHVLPGTKKNGRFTYEPSVLYSTLAEATMAKKNTSPKNDFLLLLFFPERKEEKRRRKTAHIRSSRRSSASRSSNSRPSSASSASSCAAFAPM